MTQPVATGDALSIKHLFRISGYHHYCLTLKRGIKDMDWPHRSLADLTPQELHRKAIEYHHMAQTARGQAIISALERLAIRYAALAARREVEEAIQLHMVLDAAPYRDQPELAKLIASANQAAVNETTPVKTLAQFIRTIAEGDADPYIAMGILLEGAVHLLANGVPCERQKDTAEAMLVLLADRLTATGMFDRS